VTSNIQQALLAPVMPDVNAAMPDAPDLDDEAYDVSMEDAPDLETGPCLDLELAQDLNMVLDLNLDMALQFVDETVNAVSFRLLLLVVSLLVVFLLFGCRLT
jgi:hypothetical protein